ncbi:MAG: hypothetical protein KGI27_07860 [Thaumarchaeota archaeon]|nr:hypothetical protein [Nitrososphaerota archaeon]
MFEGAGRWNFAMLAAMTTVMLSGTGMYVPEIFANAAQQTVCVLQPIDQSVPVHIVNMTTKVLAQHNETTKYIGLVQELTDRSNAGCDHVIQFQRAVNSNYDWVDKTAHYTISGNTLTLYTDTTPVDIPSSISFGGVGYAVGSGGTGGDVFAPAMTNWSCFTEALATYHQNIGSTMRESCNPYAGAQHVSDSVPFYIVHKSLEQALEKMHL